MAILKKKKDSIPSDVLLHAVVTKLKGKGKPQVLLHECTELPGGGYSYGGSGRLWIVDIDDVKLFNRELHDKRDAERNGGVMPCLPMGSSMDYSKIKGIP